MKWAILLGAAAATGSLNGLPGKALERGMKALHSSPELSKITDSVGRLAEAGRAAAVSALNSRIEQMGGMVEDRAKSAVSDVSERATGALRRGRDEAEGRPGRGRHDRDDEERAESDDRYEDEDAEYEEEDNDEGAPDDTDSEVDEENDESEEDESEEDEGERAASPRRSGGDQTRRPVARRTRR